MRRLFEAIKRIESSGAAKNHQHEQAFLSLRLLRWQKVTYGLSMIMMNTSVSGQAEAESFLLQSGAT